MTHDPHDGALLRTRGHGRGPPPRAAVMANDTYLVADLFCGAGGSSSGAKKAIAEIGGTMELVAVNHWNTAIATHQANHPTARHLVEDVSMVDPEAVVEEGRLEASGQ